MGHVHPEDSLWVFLWGLPCPHVVPAFFESSVLQLFPVSWLFAYWFVSPSRLNSWAHELVPVCVSLVSRIGLGCSKSYFGGVLFHWIKVSVATQIAHVGKGGLVWFCFLIAERMDLYCCCRAISSFLFQVCCPLVPPPPPTSKKPGKIKPTTRLYIILGSQ